MCHDLGIDNSAYSFGYIPTWTGRDNTDWATSATAQRSRKAARRILEKTRGPRLTATGSAGIARNLAAIHVG